LGIVFLVGQIAGFRQLIQDGVYLIISTNPSIPKGNPSGSFLFVITFLHGLHLIAAVFICITFTIRALLNRIHPERLLGFELAVTFWHALGVLWVYLFLFLSYLYN
jgi:cytochrome c oxidase subunit 3